MSRKRWEAAKPWEKVLGRILPLGQRAVIDKWTLFGLFGKIIMIITIISLHHLPENLQESLHLLYSGCVLLGVDSLRGELAEGNRICENCCIFGKLSVGLGWIWVIIWGKYMYSSTPRDARSISSARIARAMSPQRS